MNDSDRAGRPSLDGNAAAGEFMEIFTGDITDATVRCSNCDAVHAFGQLQAYLGGPGTVLCCDECGSMVARVATTESSVWLDLSGSTSWVFSRA